MKKVDLQVGFSCNNQCIFCAQPSWSSGIYNKSYNQLLEIIKISRNHSDHIVFRGGEPTIRKDFLKLVKAAKDCKYKKIIIKSNGRLFAYLSFCKQVLESGANEFIIELPGHTSNLHDYLTGRPDSFMQSVQGIKNLTKLKRGLTVNTVIIKSNYRNLPDITKLLVKLKVSHHQLSFVNPTGMAEKIFNSLVPRFELIKPYVKAAIDIGKKNKLKVTIKSIPLCFIKGSEKFVAKKEKNKMNIMEFNLNCKKCKYNKICEGVNKEYIKRYGWKEFTIMKVKKYG